MSQWAKSFSLKPPELAYDPYRAVFPLPSHLSQLYTMDSAQNELIIENVEILDATNYCYYAVLAFLVYDTSTFR